MDSGDLDLSLLCDGKIAIVTGASRGIGRACAEVLLREGATVVGCSREQPTAPPDDPHYSHRIVDVADPDQVEALVAETVQRFGRLDILVNNAGTHPPTRPIDDVTTADFEALLRLNLTSMFVACKAALPTLRRTRGSIINMGSAVGLYGQEGAVAYCATKGAISGMTKALAIDEASYGVRVNNVCPGAILTPLAAEVQTVDQQALVASWSWMDRWGRSEEVAELVAFLASERSAFITGQDLLVGGGTELGYGMKAGAYYEAMQSPLAGRGAAHPTKHSGTGKGQGAGR